jgi:hypothetical protein
MVPGKRRGGFSLVLVLLIAVCGMVMVGAVLYTIGGFSGASRTTVSGEDIYVRMQSEIESAKASLLHAMSASSAKLAMRSTSNINSLDDIVIYLPSGAPFPPAIVDKAIKVGGVNGLLSVRILDMRYEADKVNVGNGELIKRMPPSMKDAKLIVEDDNVGFYLIRAEVTLDGDVGGVGGRNVALETSVIQNTGP